MALDIDKLNIVIEGHAEEAAAAIDTLIDKLNELKQVTENLTNVTSRVRKAFKDITNAAKAASKETIKYASDLEQTTHINEEVVGSSNAVANSILSISGATSGARQALQSTAIVLSGLSDKMMEVYSNAITLYGGLAKSQGASGGMKQLTGSMWDVYEATYSVNEATNETAEAFSGLNQEILMLDAPGKIESFGKTTISFAERIKSALGGLSGAFSSLSKHIESRFGNLFRMVKRIALYRLIRSAIRAVTQAVKEGLDILIEWDRTYGNNTSGAAKTVDELAAKWREVKKAVGAAFMPLIQIVQPILNWLMQAVIEVANTFNQILRSIQGFSTYMKATYINTKATTESAKELRRVLFGFDELNVLNGNGGTGAAGSVSPIEFVETDTSAIMKGVKEAANFTKNQFKDAWKETKEGWEEVKQNFAKGWKDFKEGAKEAASFTSTQFTESWNESKEGWEELKKNFTSFKEWINTHISVPFKEMIVRFYEWMLKEHPRLAAFLGISQEKIDKIKLDISATANLDKGTEDVIGLAEYAHGAGAKGAILKFKTDTTISPDTQRLLSLLKVAQAGLELGAGSSSTKFSLRGGKLPSNILFANGGVPDMGTLFYAGEKGAEIVASSPSGTGVMNMKQMQDAVSNGNVQVVNTLGAVANMIVAAINSKDMNAYLDGRKITDDVARRMNERTRATGQPILVR